MDLHSLLPIFVKVVDEGSFTEAARSLRVSRPMVSQYIKELETAVGTRLIARTTRTLATTDAGARFYERCKAIIEDTESAVEELAETQSQVKGRLRVGCPFDLSIEFLPRVFSIYAAQYPEVQLELVVEDNIESVIARQLDVTFRVGWPVDTTLRSTKIASFEPILCASAAFASRTKLPTEPAQAESFPWVVLSRLKTGDRWTLVSKKREALVCARKMTTCNSSLTVRELIKAGLGIGVCPDYQVARALSQGDLVRVLPEWHIAGGGVWAIYPHDRTAPLKVKKLIDTAKQTWHSRPPANHL
jgi:DNA-binding transcriptional LysR family regulator